MELRKLGITLLALLLAAMVMVPLVSAANKTEVYYKDILITEMGSVTDDIQKTVALKNADTRLWYAKLQKVTDDSIPGLEKYLYPIGPVIGHGYDKYGTMDVQINKDSNVSSDELKEIYEIIRKAGEVNGIKNIPCKFLSLGLMKTESRTDKIRPVYGGLQIGGNGGWGTIGFRARDTNGNYGFVTAGHIGSLSSTIYQPDLYGSTYATGSISKIGSTNSDTAFVPYSNTASPVYITSSQSIYYSSYADPIAGDYVYKSGAATNLSDAEAAFINRAYNSYLGKYLPQQAYAPYTSADGDSGAPVFTWDYFDPILVGIHMGQAAPGFGVFSPMSGIRSDLGITRFSDFFR